MLVYYKIGHGRDVYTPYSFTKNIEVAIDINEDFQEYYTTNHIDRYYYLILPVEDYYYSDIFFPAEIKR